MDRLSLGLWLGAQKMRGPKARKKVRKVPKEHWFARLTVDELKKLCRAAKLAVSGAKGDLTSRLLECDATARYGAEARAPSISHHSFTFSAGKQGVSVDGLKDELKNRALSGTGSKFELVLRLLHHEPGTGDVGAATPKRTAAVETNADGSPVLDAATGQPVLKKRKPNTAIPNLDKLRERIEKKLYPAGQDKWRYD